MLNLLAAVLLLPAALVVPAGADAAAAPVCHGHRATIVGSHNASLAGTPHADVIVTNGARTVSGNGGDDLICVTRSLREVEVTGGNGDEVVLVESHSSEVSFRGDGGSDTYRGNGSFDDVTLRGDGHDRISTRGGTDIVTIVPTATPGAPRVDLGGGADDLYLDSAGTGGRYSGGGGADRLEIDHHSKQAWTIDNVQGRALAGKEVRFRWRSFTNFDMSFLEAPSVSFVGSDQAETFVQQDALFSVASTRSFQLAMGGGDDLVTVSNGSQGSVDGGAGTDELDLSANLVAGTLTADLGAGLATVQFTDRTLAWQLAGLEDLDERNYPVAVLRGDDGPNRISASASCEATVDGRGGDDVLSAATGCTSYPPPAPETGAQISGGDGNDVMTGGPLGDTLDGGPGTDSADGAQGADTCHAETVVNCELG